MFTPAVAACAGGSDPRAPGLRRPYAASCAAQGPESELTHLVAWRRRGLDGPWGSRAPLGVRKRASRCPEAWGGRRARLKERARTIESECGGSARTKAPLERRRAWVRVRRSSPGHPVLRLPPGGAAAQGYKRHTWQFVTRVWGRGGRVTPLRPVKLGSGTDHGGAWRELAHAYSSRRRCKVVHGAAHPTEVITCMCSTQMPREGQGSAGTRDRTPRTKRVAGHDTADSLIMERRARCPAWC